MSNELTSHHQTIANATQTTIGTALRIARA